jgi:hypothetical protein
MAVVMVVDDEATRHLREQVAGPPGLAGLGPLRLATVGDAAARRWIGMRLAQLRPEDVAALVAVLLEELTAPADDVGYPAHVRDRAAVLCAWSRLVIERAAQRRARTAAAIERATWAARFPRGAAPAAPGGAVADGDDASGLVTPEPSPPRPRWRFWPVCRTTTRPPPGRPAVMPGRRI